MSLETTPQAVPKLRRTDSLVVITALGEAPTVEFRRGIYPVVDGVTQPRESTVPVRRTITAEMLADPAQVVTVAGNTVPLALVFGAVQAFGDLWDSQDLGL